MRRITWLEEVVGRRSDDGGWTPDQAYGAELLVNGDFSDGSGTFPNGWTKINDNGTNATITETAPNGSAGTGAATLSNHTSAVFVSIKQAIFVTGDWYESAGEMTAYTGGRADITYSGAGGIVPLPALSSVRAVRQLERAANTEFVIQPGGALPRLYTVDNFSVKRLTPSTQQVAASADMDIRCLYTLPASPRAGDRLFLFGRISSFSSGNYWAIMLEYTGSQWNITLYSVASHTRTSQKSASNVGTTNGVRFYANGTTIRMYTTADGGANWTQRGTDLTSSTYETATDYNVFAGSQFTLGEVSSV